jgi:hypothetical protein
VQPTPKIQPKKIVNVCSLASSMQSSPEQCVKRIEELKSPKNYNYTPGGSSKSFLALLQVAAQNLFEQGDSSFARSQNCQANSFTPVPADFPKIPECAIMSSAASIVPTPQMEKEVSEAFANAMSSILPQVQLEQPKVSTGLDLTGGIQVS